ncbi:WD40 repeat-containing protein [Leptolyngbya sp. PCC 7375]|nr:WD40 repeat-containing protein [Leptolyngbya sp. PCC 7375]
MSKQKRDRGIRLNPEYRDQVRNTIKLKGHSQISLAKQLNYSRATISNLLGSKKISPDILTEVLTYLELVPIEKYMVSEQVQQSTIQVYPDVEDVKGFVGRQIELKTLTQGILESSYRIVCIHGMGGIGKTTLAQKLVYQLNPDFQYTCPIIRLNIKKLFYKNLQAIIQQLSNQKESGLSKAPNDFQSLIEHQIERVLFYLQKSACLLLFDNFESIIPAQGSLDQITANYQLYITLLKAIAVTPHQSCVIITSREIPNDLRILDTRLNTIKFFPLRDLVLEDCKTIMAAEVKGSSYVGSNEDWAELNRRYRGNPLLLLLKAREIRDNFEKNISRFLQEGEFVSEDIYEVLKSHSDRLSDDERHIIYWLALSCENPLSIADLKESILSYQIKKSLQSVVKRTEQKIPLEYSYQQYSLQPVLSEFFQAEIISKARLAIETGNIDFLNQYSLLKATANEYVRVAQQERILLPIISHLKDAYGNAANIKQHLQALVNEHKNTLPDRGYFGGNIINLLSVLSKMDEKEVEDQQVTKFDISSVPIEQADLQASCFRDCNFSKCSFKNSLFMKPFNAMLTCAFSPDGRLLATGHIDDQLCLWSVETYQRVFSYRQKMDWVHSIAFNPDGTLLACGTGSGKIVIFQVEDTTLKKIEVINAHHQRCFSVAFSHDGQLLATTGSDTEIKLWRTDNWMRVHNLEGHQKIGRVWNLAFSPTENLLASVSDDHTLRLWDITTGTTYCPPITHPSEVWSVAFSHDGKWIVTGDKAGLIRMWEIQDLTEPSMIFEGHAHGIRTLAFVPTDEALISGSMDTTIWIWDVNSGANRTILSEHYADIWSIALNIKKNLFASVGIDRQVKLWDIDSYQRIHTFRGYANSLFLGAFSPDGKLFTIGNENLHIEVFNSETYDRVAVLKGHTHVIWSLDFNPGGDLLASASFDCTIKLWNTQNWEPVATLVGHKERIRAVAFSPTDNNLLASAGDDYSIRIWDLTTHENTIIDEQNCWVQTVAFNPDGTILASGNDNGLVTLWDTMTHQCIQRIENAHSQWICALTFTPSGSTLATASKDGFIKLWDTESWEEQARLELHSTIDSLSISSNGEWLVCSAADSEITIWNLTTLERRNTFPAHSKKIYTTKFKPNSLVFASASEDESIIFWDLESNSTIKIITRPKAYTDSSFRDVKGLRQDQKEQLRELGAIL